MVFFLGGRGRGRGLARASTAESFSQETRGFKQSHFFCYILFTSGIEIHDLSEKNVNLFYHTGSNVTLCNFDSDIQKWKERPYNGEKMNIPVFAPIEFFHPFKNNDENMHHIKKYLIDYELFMNQFNLLNNEMIRITL